MELANARAQARIVLLASIETYNPARYRGGILSLHYARAQVLAPVAGLGGGPGRGDRAVLAPAGGGTGGAKDSGAAQAVFVWGGRCGSPEKTLIPDCFTYFISGFCCASMLIGEKYKN